jgi:hypothetical protein
MPFKQKVEKLWYQFSAEIGPTYPRSVCARKLKTVAARRSWLRKEFCSILLLAIPVLYGAPLTVGTEVNSQQ